MLSFKLNVKKNLILLRMEIKTMTFYIACAISCFVGFLARALLTAGKVSDLVDEVEFQKKMAKAWEDRSDELGIELANLKLNTKT